MPAEPGQKPLEPASPEEKDGIRPPAGEDHPGPDDQDDVFPEDDEDTGAEPWWM